jgi:hypothetical protein
VRFTNILKRKAIMNQITTTETQAVEQATQATPEVTPQPKPTLIHTILAAINEHINTQVNEKVSTVLEAHSAVKYIDDSFREAIKDITEESIDEHNDTEEHLTIDGVREIVDDIITEQVRREVRDIDISDQIYDAITDYDFDDKFDAYDIDDKIEQYLDSNDYPDVDRVQEIVEEVLEKKMQEYVGKAIEKEMEGWNVRVVWDRNYGV